MQRSDPLPGLDGQDSLLVDLHGQLSQAFVSLTGPVKAGRGEGGELLISHKYSRKLLATVMSERVISIKGLIVFPDRMICKLADNIAPSLKQCNR